MEDFDVIEHYIFGLQKYYQHKLLLNWIIFKQKKLILNQTKIL